MFSIPFSAKKDTSARKRASSSSMSDRRLMSVEIKEAKGLMGVTKVGGNLTSYPYVQLNLLDLGGKNINKESFKTEILQNTIDPVWNEIFTFGKFANLNSTSNLPSLSVAVFHKAAFSVSETPLGVATIYLDTIDASGDVTDLWYPLEKSGRMTQVSGQIHVRLKFSGAVTVTADVETEPLIDVFEGDNTELDGDQSPNELVVTVIQARNLSPVDSNILGMGSLGLGSKSADPLVRLKLTGFQNQETDHISKNLNPVWNKKITWSSVHDEQLSLTAIVEDYNKLSTRGHIGRFVVPLNDVKDKKVLKKWFKLKNRNLESDGVERGELELAILWRYNPAVAIAEQKKNEKFNKSAYGKLTRAAGNVLQTIGIKDDESEEEADEDVAEQPVPEETVEQKKEKKEAEEKLKEELNSIEVKSGDYQVQVHIIEARDLKAENYDGTSDPIVYIECLGQKQNTKTLYAVTTCVFDELFIFNFKELDKDAFSEGLIRVSIYDVNSNPLQKNTMIGSFMVDTMHVYSANKDHEMYRKWVPLMDDEDADDIGVQGYLKLSVQIIGPGEKLKVHNEDEELAKERTREAAAGGDIGSLCLSTPVMTKTWNYVVVTVYRCESLPVMDGKVGIGFATAQSAKTDAFCQLTFGGGKPIKTKKKTVYGDTSSAINPVFNYELWYPVSIPTMTQFIKFSVWDWDPEKNELIGNISEKMNRILQLQSKQGVGGTFCQWYNMYGAPEFKTTTDLKGNITKGAKIVGDLAKSALSGEVDPYTLYNNLPEQGSSFRGRALLRFRVETSRPPGKYDTPEIVPFRRKVKSLTKQQEPIVTEYILQGLVISGTELPSFTTLGLSAVTSVGQKKQDLRIKITIGHYEIITKPAKYEKGVCRWNEYIKSDPLLLPVLVDQIPDIFIYVLREDNKPVVFTRLKPVVKGELLGFSQPCQWFLMREDKVIDALNDGDFPGNVLLKLGFGKVADSVAVEGEWQRSLQASRSTAPYQCRVHIYQGRNMPAVDSNGLCDPYVVVNLLGQVKKSSIKYKTLFPSYYETIIFDDVNISDSNNFMYASMINFRVYDKDDFDKDDYLGTFGFNLRDANVTTDISSISDPKWFDLFKEVPNDADGQLLISVQLIPLTVASTDTLKLPSPSIVPELRDAFVEVIAIGIRDMAPYNFLPMQSPFLEIEIDSFGNRQLTSTTTSKKPTPSNPNFLERMCIPVKLPMKSLFAPPLQLRARDSRLGGYLKPVVGVGTIDIVNKIPWCLDTYKPPQSQIIKAPVSTEVAAAGITDEISVPGANKDEVAMKAQSLLKNRANQVSTDDFVASLPPEVLLDEFVTARKKDEDSGAGIFGALHHIHTHEKAKKKTGIDAVFTNADLIEEEDDVPPEWMKNRQVLSNDLESELVTTPFETYELTRGQKNGLLGSTLKVVGIFKGIVRIIEDADAEPLFSKDQMKDLFKPQKYKVRLYCIKATNLTPMDVSIFGRPAKSDPYIRVNLGKFKFDDRDNAIIDCTDVDLYKVIELDAELPGTSQLSIEIMDKDDFGSISDDLIGKTIIDLEDRIFDTRWQELGKESESIPADGAGKRRWHTKPLECRSIYTPTNKCPQGVLHCWVDIMKPEVALVFPPDDVSLPPKQIFEVRVVIWKSKDVPPMDSFEGMSDLFVKCWPEGCKPQETDTHWRCKKGKASWNWRLLFDVELGNSTRAMKFPYLHFQLWDRDVLKWNDCAGEGVIDLGKYYRKAYKNNIAIKLFEQKKGAAAARAKREKETSTKSKRYEDNGDDIAPPELPSIDSTVPTTPDAAIVGGSNPNSAAVTSNDRVYDSDDDDDTHQVISPIKSTVAPTAISNTNSKFEISKDKKVSKVVDAEKNTKSWFWSSKKSDDADQPLLKDGDANDLSEEKGEEKKDDADDEDTKEFIQSIKAMTGLWDEDPPDSSWYKIEKTDHNGGKPIPMGQICYSVQIWPKEKAVLMPVGSGRNEPNTNPFLPPPVGRLKFSWNPFVLGSQLCGPKLCAYFTCCLICAAFIVLMIFCQPFLNIAINFAFM